MFIRFDTIPACDRQTDGRTDGRTYCDSIVHAVKNDAASLPEYIAYLDDVVGGKVVIVAVVLTAVSLRNLGNTW